MPGHDLRVQQVPPGNGQLIEIVDEESTWNFSRIAMASALAVLVIGAVFVPAANLFLFTPKAHDVSAVCQKLVVLDEADLLPSPHDYCVGEGCPPQLSETHSATPIDFAARERQLHNLTSTALNEASMIVKETQVASYFKRVPLIQEKASSFEIEALQEAKDLLTCTGREVGKVHDRWSKHGDYYRSDDDWGLRRPRGYYVGKASRDLLAYKVIPALSGTCNRLFDACVHAANIAKDSLSEMQWLKRAIDQVDFLWNNENRSLSHFFFQSSSPRLLKEGADCLERLTGLVSDPTIADQVKEKAANFRERFDRIVKPYA